MSTLLINRLIHLRLKFSLETLKSETLQFNLQKYTLFNIYRISNESYKLVILTILVPVLIAEGSIKL